MVEGADSANYQAVVDVLEVIQQLNITQVGLATAEVVMRCKKTSPCYHRSCQ